MKNARARNRPNKAARHLWLSQKAVSNDHGDANANPNDRPRANAHASADAHASVNAIANDASNHHGNGDANADTNLNTTPISNPNANPRDKASTIAKRDRATVKVLKAETTRLEH